MRRDWEDNLYDDLPAPHKKNPDSNLWALYEELLKLENGLDFNLCPICGSEGADCGEEQEGCFFKDFPR